MKKANIHLYIDEFGLPIAGQEEQIKYWEKRIQKAQGTTRKEKLEHLKQSIHQSTDADRSVQQFFKILEDKIKEEEGLIASIAYTAYQAPKFQTLLKPNSLDKEINVPWEYKSDEKAGQFDGISPMYRYIANAVQKYYAAMFILNNISTKEGQQQKNLAQKALEWLKSIKEEIEKLGQIGGPSTLAADLRKKLTKWCNVNRPHWDAESRCSKAMKVVLDNTDNQMHLLKVIREFLGYAVEQKKKTDTPTVV